MLFATYAYLQSVQCFSLSTSSSSNHLRAHGRHGKLSYPPGSIFTLPFTPPLPPPPLIICTRVTVCPPFWKRVYGVSDYIYREAVLHLQTSMPVNDVRQDVDRAQVKRDNAFQWLIERFELCANIDPAESQYHKGYIIEAFDRHLWYLEYKDQREKEMYTATALARMAGKTTFCEFVCRMPNLCVCAR